MRKGIVVLAVIGCLWSNSNAFAKVTNDQEFAVFFTHYYEQQNTSDAPEAVEYFLETRKSIPDWLMDRRYVGMMAYAFGRMLQLNPELIPKYQKIYDQADEKERLFLLSIFGVYHNNEVESFLKDRGKKASVEEIGIIDQILANEPLGKNYFIHQPRVLPDLDFLWAEFFISGDGTPINFLIDLLAGPDIFSSRLLDFMLSVNEKSDVEVQQLERLLYQELGLTIDVKNMQIDSLIDLDFTFSRYVRTGGSTDERASFSEAIQSMLKINIQDIEKMIMKESALLSLQNNLPEHSVLVGILRQQAGIRKGKIVQILNELLEGVSSK